MIVFDPDLGKRNRPDLGDAFWLIESPHNRALAERVWATGSTDSNSAVFQAQAVASLDEEALSRFEDVDLHHPMWTEITFLGVPLTNDLRDQLEGYALAIIPADDAFVVKR